MKKSLFIVTVLGMYSYSHHNIISVDNEREERLRRNRQIVLQQHDIEAKILEDQKGINFAKEESVEDLNNKNLQLGFKNSRKSIPPAEDDLAEAIRQSLETIDTSIILSTEGPVSDDDDDLIKIAKMESLENTPVHTPTNSRKPMPKIVLSHTDDAVSSPDLPEKTGKKSPKFKISRTFESGKTSPVKNTDDTVLVPADEDSSLNPISVPVFNLISDDKNEFEEKKVNSKDDLTASTEFVNFEKDQSPDDKAISPSSDSGNIEKPWLTLSTNIQENARLNNIIKPYLSKKIEITNNLGLLYKRPRDEEFSVVTPGCYDLYGQITDSGYYINLAEEGKLKSDTIVIPFYAREDIFNNFEANYNRLKSQLPHLSDDKIFWLLSTYYRTKIDEFSVLKKSGNSGDNF